MEEKIKFLEEKYRALNSKVEFMESLIDDIVSAIDSTQDHEEFNVKWLLSEWKKYEQEFINK